jgi:acetyl-CoA carboxylase biotin carboxyl carrier protein
MSGEPQNDQSFDLEKLRQLVEMMESHGLTEVHLRKGSEQWRLRRGAKEQPMAYAPAAYQPPPMMATPVPVAAAAAPAPAAPAAVDAGLIQIKSPTVGTFYASPTPDDPPFVQVGAVISRETVVCIIEAMKVFNQIPAEVSGTIVSMLVKNGDAVEFGQPLFNVKP